MLQVVINAKQDVYSVQVILHVHSVIMITICMLMEDVILQIVLMVLLGTQILRFVKIVMIVVKLVQDQQLLNVLYVVKIHKDINSL